MIGTSRLTARPIDGMERLSQSLADILSTPINSRVMRRDYGSQLPELIDAPMNGETVVDVFAAAAEAIDRWEPEFRLRRVEIAAAGNGRMELRLTGEIGTVDVEVRA